MKEYDVRDLACPGPVLKLRGLLDDGEREIQFHVADELCRSNVTRFAASRNLGTEVEAQGRRVLRRELSPLDPKPSTARPTPPIRARPPESRLGRRWFR